MVWLVNSGRELFSLRMKWVGTAWGISSALPTRVGSACASKQTRNLTSPSKNTSVPYISIYKEMFRFVVNTFVFVFVLSIINRGETVRCYQCGSDHDLKGQDNCGAYKRFDKQQHVAVECNSEESHMPGSFCMKITQQSPKGFIWDGRWRQVIRRCASVADTGVTGVCNWGVFDNGVYWEECYCSEDECNSSSVPRLSFILGVAAALAAVLRSLR